MKKELLIAAMTIGLVVALSANGQQDDETQSFGRGQSMGRGYNNDREEVQQFRDDRLAERQKEMESWIEDQELISLEGTLNLVNGELPYIEADGVKYALAAPWYDLREVELTEGMTVSVEGYESADPGLRWNDSENTLMLTKILIDGEEIEIDHIADGSGFQGGMSGGNGAQGRFAMAQGGPARGKGGPAGAGGMGRQF